MENCGVLDEGHVIFRKIFVQPGKRLGERRKVHRLVRGSGAKLWQETDGLDIVWGLE